MLYPHIYNDRELDTILKNNIFKFFLCLRSSEKNCIKTIFFCSYFDLESFDEAHLEPETKPIKRMSPSPQFLSTNRNQNSVISKINHLKKVKVQ